MIKVGVFLLVLGWLSITAGIALGAWSHYYDWDRDTLGICILLILQGVLPLGFGILFIGEGIKEEDEAYTARIWQEAQDKRVNR